jgi:putative endonuclease
MNRYSTSQSRITGNHTETAACKLLQAHHLKILARNFRCKQGEIDIIAQDGDTLVFVEVRHRSHSGFGNGIDSVTKHKQRKIIKTAYVYLQQHQLFEKHPCRFDIVSAASLDQLHWIRDAFQT